MSSRVVYYFVAFAIILTHSTITSVKGQCTVQGCENEDTSTSIIVAEIKQLRVELFDHVNKQVQNIHDILTTSFQQTTGQHEAVMKSLQAVDRRPDDIYIKQGQSIHELLNETFQEMKNQHGTVMTSLQAVDQRRLQEHDIYIKQIQSIGEFLNQSVQQTNSFHELLNESFQEMKNQIDAVTRSLQAIDRRRSQEQDIYIKQIQGIHELCNQSVQQQQNQHDTVMMSLREADLRSQEHDIFIKQVPSIHRLLNESFQRMISQHDIVMTSLRRVDLRSQEHDIYLKQVPSIHRLLNESFQRMKSQHDTLNLSLQAVDSRLQNYQIDTKNQTQKSWQLVTDICGPGSQVWDCSDIKASGKSASGVYEVCVGHQPDRVCTNAFCDMRAANSTSLVFQRRKDGSVNFTRLWTEYKRGFGNPNGEFWLGNEMLHLLTSKRNYKLRVDLEDFHGNKSFAEYTRFSVSSSTDKYRLTVSGYSGNAGDSMNKNNGKPFTTLDADNDDCGSSSNCAWSYGGAWWYGCCSDANLNGLYRQRYDQRSLIGVLWYPWHRNHYYSLKASEMKLVPVS